MTRQLGIGVVGLTEGRTLLVALTQPVPPIVGQTSTGVMRAPHARAVAACDINADKLAAVQQECPDLFYTPSYKAMLARPDVDIVAIYTPDQFHGEQIAQAFEAGKQVICTKPLVNTFDDGRRILEASRRTGGKLLVGQSTRFFESFQRQRQGYERGEIGTVELVDAHYVHRMDWYYERSPWATRTSDWIFLGLSHPIDLVRWYLGPVVDVQAYGSHSAVAQHYNVQSYDIYTVNLRTADGRLGRAMGNYGLHELPSARNAIECVLYGSHGTSLAQYHDMRYYHSAPDGTEVKEDMLYSKRGYYFNNEVHGMHYGEFATYTDYFARALLDGIDYSPNLQEGLETVCVMEAARQSAQTGQPIAVSPLLEAMGLKK